MIPDSFYLNTKIDIPFQEANLIIHNPSITEIAYIGEKKFFQGCEYLIFSKQNLTEQDKNNLQKVSNFEILMTILKDKSASVNQVRESIEKVLFLLFPDYKTNFLPMSIMLSKKTQSGLETHLIDKDNFESFKNIVSKMFCMQYIHGNGPRKYNPGGPQARALVKKFEERAKKLAELKRQPGQQQTSLFYSYISILSVGLKKDKNLLAEYTVYQLIDQFRRFTAKDNYDLYIKLKIAGAKDLDEVKNWKGSLNNENL